MEFCVFLPNNQDQAAEGRHMGPWGRFLIRKTFCRGGNSFLEPIVVQDLFYLIKKNNYATICEELCTFGTICEYKISQHGNLKVHLAASNIQKESAAKWIIQWICAQQHCKSHFDMRHPVVDRIRPRPSLSPSHDFPESIPNPYHQHWGPSSEKPVRRVFGFSGVDILPSEVQSCATN